MATPKVHLYVAASLDGYISTADGGVEWLDPFNTEDYGFLAFQSTIGAAVMGRVTYVQSLGFPPPPGPPLRMVVLTRNKANCPPGPAELYDGDLKQLVAELKSSTSKDIWLLGGGQTVKSFLDESLVDKITLTVMPLLLGRGLSLFPPNDGHLPLTVTSHRIFANGAIELIYERTGT